MVTYRIRKMIAWGMAVTMTAGMTNVLTGCGAEREGQAVETSQVEDTSQGDEDTPAWKKYAGEPVTLDWYVNYSWFAIPWGENAVSQKITEETGVNINFITPIGNETEKLNALIASDSLPDLITLGYWEPQVNQMIEENMVYALNELADDYDAYFWQVTDADVVNWYTMDDGNIYGYPCSTVTPKQVKEHDDIISNQTFLVRKDIYEAIGSPDMTTPKYYDRYTDPEYVIWLKMFRELGEEGLLANDIFVDTRIQMEEKLAKGRYFCMLYQYSDTISQQKALYENDPDSIYMAVEGPRNSNGDDPTLPTNNMNGWTLTLISKNCKYPERAIAFMDYMMSEHGQMLIYLGVEGVTYDIVDGKPVLKEDVSKILNSDRETYDRLYGADDAYWMLQNNVMQLQWEQKAGPATEQLLVWACKYTVYNGQYDVSLSTSPEIAAMDEKCTKLWSETLPKLLLASNEAQFDEIFEEFVGKRNAMGYQEVLKQKTVLMNAAKEKMGISE